MPLLSPLTTSQTLLAANPRRKRAYLTNTSTAPVYVVLGDVATVGGATFIIQPQTTVTHEGPEALSVIWSGSVFGVTGNVRGTEVEDEMPHFSATRLQCNDRETKWALIIDVDNGSGLWTHEGGSSVCLVAGEIDLDRGVASPEATAGNTAVITAIDHDAGTMGVAFVFGVRSRYGGQFERSFGDSRIRDLSMTDGVLDYINTEGVATFPIPATLESPYGVMAGDVLAVGDTLSFLSNGGGDKDVFTHRLWYVVKD